MKILASFCSSGVPGKPALGLLDPSSSSFQFVAPAEGLQDSTGVTGLAASDRFLFVVPQSSLPHQSLLIYDREQLDLVNRHEFSTASDIHSVAVSDNFLYVVSTGSDELFRLTMEDSQVILEEVHWRPTPDGPRTDQHHLNGLSFWKGHLYISGFGEKAGDSWKEAFDGFVFDVTSGEKIADGLDHPHSLLCIGSDIAFCESRNRSVRFANSGRKVTLPGYTRGISRIHDSLFVATSTDRKVSKSTGRVNRDRSEDFRCAIHRCSLHTLQRETSYDLSSYSAEIYDLLPIDRTDKWRLIPAAELASEKQIWWDQVELAVEELANVIPADESFLLIDEDKLGFEGRVAGRSVLPYSGSEDDHSGPPQNSKEAIRRIKRMVTDGMKFIVFGWPAFWWLQHYKEFADHLNSHYELGWKSDRLMIFIKL